MNAMMAFLIIVLVAGLILVGVVMAAGPKGGGARRRGSRGQVGVGRGHSAHGRVQTFSRDELRAQWQNIMAVSATGGSGLKSAILDADKLFDHALQMSGVHGETMGERLKNARGRFSSYQVYDGIWRAHKLRNTMAHEIGFDLVPSQVREALHDFERGLRELGVL